MTITDGRCVCGEEYLIEHDSPRSCRMDRKRVFPRRKLDTGWDSFRCEQCGRPVAESVKGAEYEPA